MAKRRKRATKRKLKMTKAAKARRRRYRAAHKGSRKRATKRYSRRPKVKRKRKRRSYAQRQNAARRQGAGSKTGGRYIRARYSTGPDVCVPNTPDGVNHIFDEGERRGEPYGMPLSMQEQDSLC